jgi:hypothetical protein
MMLLNILIPAIDCVFFAIQEQHPDQFKWAHWTFMGLDSLLIFVSGVMLINAVLKIWKYVKDKQDEVNIR